jgi:hypothetical protein
MEAMHKGHENLARLVGSWTGAERMAASAWSPEELHTTGRIEATMKIDGHLLVTDYRQEQDGQIGFRGHGAYAYDEKNDRYSMYWFDSQSTNPDGPIYGRWEDDTLTFEGRDGETVTRYVYELRDADEYRFRIERSEDGGGAWQVWMDSTWRRTA